jgi:polyribonucleotide nucleotidyltransferase
MDIKIKGISSELLAEALGRAHEVRMEILNVMNTTISGPREELSPNAPQMITIQVDPDKLGAVIGSGGKTVRSIQEEFDVRVDIEDDGTIFIAATDGQGVQRARERIERLTEEAELGKIYTGRVVRITDFGAFVEILPGTDGLVHISQLSDQSVPSVRDVVNINDEILVMVTDIGPDNKIRLSRRAVLEGWTLEEARQNDRPSRSRGRGGRRSSRR